MSKKDKTKKRVIAGTRSFHYDTHNENNEKINHITFEDWKKEIIDHIFNNKDLLYSVSNLNGKREIKETISYIALIFHNRDIKLKEIEENKIITTDYDNIYKVTEHVHFLIRFKNPRNLSKVKEIIKTKKNRKNKEKDEEKDIQEIDPELNVKIDNRAKNIEENVINESDILNYFTHTTETAMREGKVRYEIKDLYVKTCEDFTKTPEDKKEEEQKRKAKKQQIEKLINEISELENKKYQTTDKEEAKEIKIKIKNITEEIEQLQYFDYLGDFLEGEALENWYRSKLTNITQKGKTSKESIKKELKTKITNLIANEGINENKIIEIINDSDLKENERNEFYIRSKKTFDEAKKLFVTKEINRIKNKNAKIDLQNIYIFGESGTGKTRLAIDVANAILKQKNISKNSIYLSPANSDKPNWDWISNYLNEHITIFNDLSDKAFSWSHFLQLFEPEILVEESSRFYNKAWLSEYSIITKSKHADKYVENICKENIDKKKKEINNKTPIKELLEEIYSKRELLKTILEEILKQIKENDCIKKEIKNIKEKDTLEYSIKNIKELNEKINRNQRTLLKEILKNENLLEKIFKKDDLIINLKEKEILNILYQVQRRISLIIEIQENEIILYKYQKDEKNKRKLILEEVDYKEYNNIEDFWGTSKEEKEKINKIKMIEHNNKKIKEIETKKNINKKELESLKKETKELENQDIKTIREEIIDKILEQINIKN